MKETLTGIIAVVAISTALTTLVSVTADAADVGFCATPEKMTVVLKAEGQRSLAAGNKHILVEQLPNGELRAADYWAALIFTADMDGKVGYIVQADTPLSTTAKEMCIVDRMHEVKLYDARIPVIYEETLVNSTPEAAARKCDDLAKRVIVARGGCGFHNTYLKKLATIGDRVAIQGLGAYKGKDGAWQSGASVATITLVTEEGTEDSHTGTLLNTILPEGASSMITAFKDANYTTTALNVLKSKNTNLAGKTSPEPPSRRPE